MRANLNGMGAALVAANHSGTGAVWAAANHIRTGAVSAVDCRGAGCRGGQHQEVERRTSEDLFPRL